MASGRLLVLVESWVSSRIDASFPTGGLESRRDWLPWVSGRGVCRTAQEPHQRKDGSWTTIWMGLWLEAGGASHDMTWLQVVLT